MSHPLTRSEADQLVTDCDRLANLKHSTALPHAFTEQGVAMLPAVLHCDMELSQPVIPSGKPSHNAPRKNMGKKWFPDDFMFQLSEDEVDLLLSQNAIPSSKQLALDIEKFNRQYPAIDVQTFKQAHDRFLIIDDSIYHIGASLKDLGKKWFAFSKMEASAIDMLAKVKA